MYGSTVPRAGIVTGHERHGYDTANVWRLDVAPDAVSLARIAELGGPNQEVRRSRTFFSHFERLAMPDIKLPDGAVRHYGAPVTVADIAASIGPGLAKAAIAGNVDGKVVDTSHVVDRDATVAILTERDAEGLDVIRHSTAHLLAYAVKELFPDAQVTIGPVIEDGFYYDFSFKRPFTPEDLAAIERKMAELAKKDEPVTRMLMPRDEAVKFFESLGEHYKAEIIASIPSDQPISLYAEGAFIDLCRGPHVPSTGRL